MFKFFAIFGCILAISFACRTIESKANGQVQPSRSSNPTQVLIETFLTYTQKYMCSGVLVHEQFVLTTTSCVFGAMFVNVHMYAHDLLDVFEDDREIYKSDEVIMHPDYDELKHLNDIALVRLKKPLDLTAKPYGIVKLPKSTDPLTPGTPGTVYGWALLDYKDENASRLKHSQEMVVIDDRACSSVFGPFDEERGNEGRMCISRFSGEKNCVGDSGAPFMIANVLYGLLSFGQKQACESAGSFNGIQDIRYHLEWIEGEIKK